MKFSLVAPILLAGVEARYHQRDLHNFSPRDYVYVGPSGICPAFPITTVQLQPVFYSEFLPYNTIIDPFRNGRPVAITNAPTTFVVSDFLTSTIFPPPTSGQSTTATSSDGAASSPSSISTSSISTGSISTGSISTGSISTSSISTSSSNIPSSTGTSVGTTPPFQNGSSTSTSSSSASGDGSVGPSLGSSSTAQQSSSNTASQVQTSSSAAATSGSVSTVSGNPSASVTSTSATSVSVTAASPSTTVLVSPLSLGEGLPVGAVSDISTGTFVFLAFSTAGAPQAKRAVHVERQVISAEASVSAAAVVNLDPPSPSATGNPGIPAAQCDGATPFNLIDGVLSSGLFVLDKILGGEQAQLGSLVDSTLPKVNITFSLNNGILSWVTPDQGAATFYSCAGQVYAGFPDINIQGCERIIVGAIAGSVCSALVAATRPVDPGFTNPVQIGTTTSRIALSTGSSSRIVLPSGSSTDIILPTGSSTRIVLPSGSSSVTSIIPTSSPINVLTPECRALQGTTGDAFYTQLALCRASLGDLVNTNPGVLICLVEQAFDGNAVLSCLLNVLGLPPLTTSSVIISIPTSSTESAPSSSASPITNLTPACRALEPLVGNTIPSQLALCRLSLGDLPQTNAQVASCLNVDVTGTTIGASIVICLESALGLPERTSSTTSSRTLSLTVPSVSLPSVSIPSVSLPSVSLSLSSVSLPSVSVSLPSVSLSLSSPSLPSASVSLPSVSLPSVSLPSMSLPSVSLPSVSLPSVSLPSVSLPSVSLPSVSLPSVSLPSVSLPSLSLSSVTVPSASVSLPSISLPTVSLSLSSVSLPSVSASLPSVSLPTVSLSLSSLSLPSVSVSVSSLSLPSVSLPSISLSSVSLPSASLPSISLPSASLPSVSVPSVSLPSVSLPSVSLPSVSLSSVSVPSVSLTSASIPSVSLPSVSLPSVSLPSVSLSVTLPSVSLSSLSIPSLSLSSVSIPSVSLPSVSLSLGTVTASSASSSALPSSILPAACDALDGLTGLNVAAQLALCTTSLGSLALEPEVEVCLNVIVTGATLGSSIAGCLRAALSAILPISTRTTSTLTITSRTSSATASSTALLSAACQALDQLTGLNVAPQLALCTTSLGNLALLPEVTECLTVAIDVDTLGSDIVSCLEDALTPTATTSGTLSLTGITATATPTALTLTPACQALDGLTGLSITTQLALCSSSLGPLVLEPAVATCLATTIDTDTDGGDIVDCLVDALLNPLSSTSRTASGTMSATALPTPIGLTAACEALSGLSGVDVTSQLTLCAASLGPLALEPAAATCLATTITVNTQGDDIVDCLLSALQSPAGTTSGATTTASATGSPTCLIELPEACQAIDALTGLDLLPQLPLCQLSLVNLGSLANLPATLTCLNTALVTVLTDGTTIVDCLENVLFCNSGASTGSTTVAAPTSSTSPSALPSCLASLPIGCTALSSLDGFAVAAQTPLCALALGAFAIDNVAVETCLSTTITAVTSGASIVNCIEAAILCPGSATTASSITATSSALGTASPICLSALPSACEDLAFESGIGLLSGLSVCTLSLSTEVRDLPAVGTCLTADISQLSNGLPIVECLRNAILCPGASPSSSTGAIASSSTSSLPIPTCLASLPSSCNDLSLTNGFLLTIPFAECLVDITPLVFGQTLSSVTTCLNTATINANTQGASVVECLTAAAICPVPVGSTTSAIVPDITSSSATTVSTIAVTLPSCLATLPPLCASISGTGIAALLTQVQACQLSILPQLSVEAEARAAVCLATGALTVSTTGIEIVACLNDNVLCSSSATTRSTEIAVPTTTTAAAVTTSIAPVVSPNCITSLPGACTALSGSNGLALLTSLPVCQVSLLDELSLLGQAKALLCLTLDGISAFPATQGSTRLQCLQNNVICGGSNALPL